MLYNNHAITNYTKWCYYYNNVGFNVVDVVLDYKGRIIYFDVIALHCQRSN